LYDKLIMPWYYLSWLSQGCVADVVDRYVLRVRAQVSDEERGWANTEDPDSQGARTPEGNIDIGRRK
jgi:hypothetical protein